MFTPDSSVSTIRHCLMSFSTHPHKKIRQIKFKIDQLSTDILSWRTAKTIYFRTTNLLIVFLKNDVEVLKQKAPNKKIFILLQLAMLDCCNLVFFSLRTMSQVKVSVYGSLFMIFCKDLIHSKSIISK